MVNRRLFALALALTIWTPAAWAADPCGTGASAAEDALDVAAVREQIEKVCPCASFDASTIAKNHPSYVTCARAVVNDASDGTPIGGTISLRRQCKGSINRISHQSDCGFVPADDRNPCCKHVVASGKNRGAIKKSATCVTKPVVVQNDCALFHFVADACSGDATNSCNPLPAVVQTTVTIPSAAEPANTPGTTGVTVTSTKLLTQFGGPSFSLNHAIYTRYRLGGTPRTPDAILILVPGFEASAGYFAILAENLITKSLLTQGQVVEVWGFDRRTNQLEDRVGLDIAETTLDPQIALDWLYGGELGLTLDPALVAGPNRRAVFYDDPQADVPFFASWTNLVFSRDIDAVVAAADAAVFHHNVFLGGHSAGTGFTARYASTDFDLTGVGPAEPGYAKLRGLVLLEGGGGSTAGAGALTADTLDRIEAKFGGGLFGAVRDNAARCVDGTTACTIATEAVDCVGQVPPKCTLPTTAYATGLLNPRILSTTEVVAIQGATDPDGGQAILSVDQGAPGNNAIAIVPDLASLSVLPIGTVEAGLGSFIDDDGAIASGLAPFVATAVGAPGPTVGGVLTWLDISESASFPPCPGAGCVTPDNGPAPTALPAGHWGLEKEVTSFSRLMSTYYKGDTNFVDWYYPVAGPSVTAITGVCKMGLCTVGNVGAVCANNAQCTQSINLDSTLLSVGRGRRDIENLTQAASVNIPVICFGGTNGLTPVPGNYTAFASSIGACTAPSCDGTPRVVDASMPNPAFPTFGDVNGGFEVHMNEGFAHVDVVTADDGPDNNVITPLAAFLKRNAQ